MPGAVRREVLLPASPAVVWAALTRPDELAEWMGADVAIDPRPGGAVEARWPDGGWCRGIGEAVEPGRRLAVRWRRLAPGGFGLTVGGASRVEFVLEEALAGETRLSVLEEPCSAVGARARAGAMA